MVDHERRRAELIDVVWQLIVEDGLPGITIRRVAERSGWSSGAVRHYLPTRELTQGLPGLAELCGGVAFLETFAKEDETEGDDVGFQPRPAKFYRDRFAALGFRFLGSHCWLSPARVPLATALELPA